MKIKFRKLFRKIFFEKYFWKKLENFSKIEKSKNQNFRKTKFLKIEKFSRFSKFSKKYFFEKIFFGRKKFRSTFFFDEICSDHHVRQPTLIRDASRAPRSDVAALRRKGNSQNPLFWSRNPPIWPTVNVSVPTIEVPSVVAFVHFCQGARSITS